MFKWQIKCDGDESLCIYSRKKEMHEKIFDIILNLNILFKFYAFRFVVKVKRYFNISAHIFTKLSYVTDVQYDDDDEWQEIVKAEHREN